MGRFGLRQVVLGLTFEEPAVLVVVLGLGIKFVVAELTLHFAAFVQVAFVVTSVAT